MKVMIVVTHLLGTGHLGRALTLAQAYQRAGDSVCVMSGGMPAPLLVRDFKGLVQLPPVRSDGVDFTRLLEGEDTLASPQTMKARQTKLLGTLSDFAPDIILTELFPFGRRILRDEFQALLTAAKSQARPPLICASIRDILAPPSKPRKAAFADEMIAAFYDAVLVHSDPALTPLELSWPVSERLRAVLHYTGFVAPAPADPHPQGTGTGEIIVSAGGGDVGDPVYLAAMEAAATSGQRTRLLIGGADPAARIARLRKSAPPHLLIEQARPDFRQMLYGAAASVSLCGYNTALDILQAGTPAVFIPFDEGNEVEQGLRAQALSRRDHLTTLRRADLTPARLNEALAQVMAATRTPARHSFDGAAQTVTITHALRGAM